MVIIIWTNAVVTSLAPFLGWGSYIPEGILDSCTTDYLSKDFNNRSYGIFIFVWCYVVPLSCILYAYFFIIKSVAAHESAMRAQAKKMNVASLRSGTEGESAEMRVAKVASSTSVFGSSAGHLIALSLYRVCSSTKASS